MTDDERCKKLHAWLKWCYYNCDDSPMWNFGTDATQHIHALLNGKDAPMPDAIDDEWPWSDEMFAVIDRRFANRMRKDGVEIKDD